jgi:hypothetical protein
MKKLILSLCISGIALNASICDTAYQNAVYYSTLANNYNLNTKESACIMANNLEQVVNNMGTLKANSCSQFNASTFSNYTQMLIIATQKCGH